jgi:hypothetical protein
VRRVLARSILIGSLAATLLTGTALGHECFIASRSDTGDLAAGSHSKVWLTVATLEDLFVAVPQFVPEANLPPLTSTQLAWAVDQGRAAGMPNQFTIFIGNHVLAEGTPAMAKHSADGKGLDHVFDWLPVVLGIYGQALTH